MASFADFDHRKVEGAPHTLVSMCNHWQTALPLENFKIPINTTPVSTVGSFCGPRRLDRPVRHRRSVSLRLKVLVVGRASAANTCPPARAIQPPAPSPDETARARLSVCGRPYHAPRLLAHMAQRRAMCVMDTAASCVCTWLSVLRTGGRLSSCTPRLDRTFFSIHREQNEQRHVRSLALTVKPRNSSGSWGAHRGSPLPVLEDDLIDQLSALKTPSHCQVLAVVPEVCAGLCDQQASAPHARHSTDAFLPTDGIRVFQLFCETSECHGHHRTPCFNGPQGPSGPSVNTHALVAIAAGRSARLHRPLPPLPRLRLRLRDSLWSGHALLPVAAGTRPSRLQGDWPHRGGPSPDGDRRRPSFRRLSMKRGV